MGKLILDKAVQALSDGGIPVRRAMPAEKAAPITESVAAVSLQAMDVRNKTVTVLATILTPAALGAAACEETALKAGQLLSDAGGKCSVGPCQFHGRIGCFYAEVTGAFNSKTPIIRINDTVLTHVLAFTCWRTLDDQVTDWTEAKWNFRLEEYFPMGTDEEANPVDPFILIHISDSGSEMFLDSTWTYQRRIWDASGVRQIRLGVAEGHDVG